ncbi:MAG: hypothetical protein ACK40X_13320, partial [Armatimonadota bacterium]
FRFHASFFSRSGEPLPQPPLFNTALGNLPDGKFALFAVPMKPAEVQKGETHPAIHAIAALKPDGQMIGRSPSGG